MTYAELQEAIREWAGSSDLICNTHYDSITWEQCSPGSPATGCPAIRCFEILDLDNPKELEMAKWLMTVPIEMSALEMARRLDRERG